VIKRKKNKNEMQWFAIANRACVTNRALTNGFVRSVTYDENRIKNKTGDAVVLLMVVLF